MIKHFTATTFISTQTHTLLHFHEKNKLWLPAGGHIEENETPLEAAKREAYEETGIEIEILPTNENFQFTEPAQIISPVSILLEDIEERKNEPKHQHIDLIFFAKPVMLKEIKLLDGWYWVSEEELNNDRIFNQNISKGNGFALDDVKILGLNSIRKCKSIGVKFD
ncbi:MAG: NUDIX domain-containing protein [SAR202 cluster bacterium]|nr:nucleoside triphosphate hydrolase [Chloroflexota bacterium]MQG51789.1 NUDIX domain-containing protein [SAR202 cluster bacterium]|tara:strand:+ start:9238 stop:9735 length:498 start_codon:yes stop_codon:yes gene_type:complete